MGQVQVKLPSVLTQVPPPLQISGLSSHSLISVQAFPSALVYPVGHSQSFLLQRSQGEPQATPIEQQHSVRLLSWGRLFSHLPWFSFVQQEPFLLSSGKWAKISPVDQALFAYRCRCGLCYPTLILDRTRTCTIPAC